MPKLSLHDIVSRVEKLPELPQAAMRVSQMIDDENTNAEKLANVIKIDASLTSQVLRLCNSAAYGFSRRISTVKEAVAILGFKTLRSMVYTIIAKVALDKPVPGYNLEEGDLFYNALTCAIYARHIAQKERFPDPELAFTGGLLRDIGKLVLGDAVGANYFQIEQICQERQLDFMDAEEAVLGFNHCMVGTRVAEKWNLPPLLVSCIKYHHKPLKLPLSMNPMEEKLVTIVHLADVFTHMIGRGNGSEGLMFNMDVPAVQKAGIQLTEESVERLLGELADLESVIQSLADSLKLEG